MTGTGNSLQNLEIVGGDLALDFVNTVHSWHDDPLPDHLHGFEDLLAWAGLVGLIDEAAVRRFRSAPPREQRRAFRAAIDLRAALHRLFVSVAAGRTLPQDALDRLTGVLHRTARWRRLQADPASRGKTLRGVWDFARAPAEALLGPIAWRAAGLLENGPLDRLKECPSDHCGWLFLDTSKNRSRTWCSMKACGNAAKVRRFRRRRAAADAESS